MKHLLAAARQCALRIPAEAAVCCAAAFLLTAVSTGGQYAPWALAAVAVAGVGWRGLAATVCAGVGALAFLDFQPGLRHAAAAGAAAPAPAVSGRRAPAWEASVSRTVPYSRASDAPHSSHSRPLRAMR